MIYWAFIVCLSNSCSYLFVSSQNSGFPSNKTGESQCVVVPLQSTLCLASIRCSSYIVLGGGASEPVCTNEETFAEDFCGRRFLAIEGTDDFYSIG